MSAPATSSQLQAQARRYILLERLREGPASREELQALLGYDPQDAAGRVRVCQLLGELRERDGVVIHNFNPVGSHRGGYYMAIPQWGWNAPERQCMWRHADGSRCETRLNRRNPGPLCLVHQAMVHDQETAVPHDPPEFELVGVGA